MPVIIDGTLGVNAAAVTTTSWNPTNLNIPGNAVIGDAAADTLTINASTISAPNGLNIDSNTFVIDAANNRIGIGTTAPAADLHVQSAAYPTISVRNTSAATGFPVVQLIDTRTSGESWQIENGRTLGSLNIRDNTAVADRFTIDSSGNISIGGTTPKGWYSSQKAIELGGGGSWNASVASGASMSFTSNAYYDSTTTWKAKATGYASRIDVLGTGNGDVILRTTSGSTAADAAITWSNTVTFDKSSTLTIASTDTATNPSVVVSTPGSNKFSTVRLVNTATNGREYQVGVGGPTASPANQWYIYDNNAAAIRMAINSDGYVGIGTITQSAKLHLYSPSADGSSAIIENGGINDAGLRFKTTIADYKIGAGVGTGQNAFTIYDIGSGSQRLIMSGGNTNIGTANAYSKLSVQTASSDGNVGNWDAGQFVVNPGGGTQTTGVGISVDTSTNTGYIAALSPTTSWRSLKVRSYDFTVLSNGSNINPGLVVDSLRRVTMPGQPGFHAYGTSGVNQTSGSIVKFTTIQFNTASCYSTSTGLFTAPVTGMYQFNFTGLTFAITSYFYGAFVVNGVASRAVWHLPQTSLGDYMFASISAVFYLSANDTVGINQAYNGGTPYLENNRSQFSGYLIG